VTFGIEARRVWAVRERDLGQGRRQRLWKKETGFENRGSDMISEEDVTRKG